MGITTSTPYGRQNILWPDFAHEGGSALHGKITSSIAEISNNTLSVWSGSQTLANGASFNFEHNFGMSLSELTIAIYVSGAFVQEGSSAAWTIAQVDTNNVTITNNTGSSATFFAYALGINLKKVIGDASVSKSGLVSAADQTFNGTKTFDDGIATDTISEKTAAAGVTADGVTLKDGNIEAVGIEQFTQQSSTPATPASGKTKFYVKNDGVAYILGADGVETPVGSGSTIERVSHVGHGFIVGTPLYDAGTNLAKCDCFTETTAEAFAMVSRVIDANTFEVITNGLVAGLVAANFKEGSLPADGSVCWLCDVSGKLSVTPPAVVGQIRKPIFFVRSSGGGVVSGYFQNMRGDVAGGGNASTAIGLANNATTTIHTINVPIGSGGAIEGVIFVDATTDTVITFKVEFTRFDSTTYNITPSFGAGTVLSGLTITNSGSAIQVTLPSVTGFSTATATFNYSSIYQGATLPLPISARQVLGDTSGTAVPAGAIGEVKSSTITSDTAGSTTLGTTTVATSVDLTAGRWRIVGQVPYMELIGVANDTGSNAQGVLLRHDLYNSTDASLLFTKNLPGLGKSTVNNGYSITSGTIEHIVDLAGPKTVQMRFYAAANSGSPTLTSLVCGASSTTPVVLTATRIA